LLLSVRSINARTGVILKVWTIDGKKPIYLPAPFDPYYYSFNELSFGNAERVSKILSDLKRRDMKASRCFE